MFISSGGLWYKFAAFQQQEEEWEAPEEKNCSSICHE